ncbi:sodium channel subunit beta-4 [Mastacembelus armatus]|uniref:Sodium channel, voltage-gated, type IV, beta a n=1 Tax=Mastacembelus armatus TaxID=205130 RepID=A0A3Q3LAV0_9TELE|nr:sodium channel subunit beta-4 [Mastacembelus armatus]XP_026189169.1 sodium channel subunit beta-4 [Mastacembelus armatus]XP_026189178.1 sodium channel subunit beta-4 [Mastacembelus armatus]
MASEDSTGSSVSGRLRSGDLLHAALAVALLLGVWSVGGLEVTTGKVSSVEAMNGSTVLLPCTYSSCIGIRKLYFSWHYNDNGTMIKLCEAEIPMEGVEPRVNVYHERVEFVGSSKSNNISILLWNITFEDQGEYICFARNPKEKNRNHSAVFTLIVVDQMKEVDNTLTVIIVSVLGGVIGLVIIVMVIKALVVHFLRKDDEKNKECLVSSGNDNTENGLSGAKADNKGTPKA